MDITQLKGYTPGPTIKATYCIMPEGERGYLLTADKRTIARLPASNTVSADADLYASAENLLALARAGIELAEHICGVAKLITAFGFDKPPDGEAWSDAVDKARALLAQAGE